MKSPTSAEGSSDHARSWSPAVRIALLYAVISGVWIVTSDVVVHMLVRDVRTAEFVSVIKGWFFVAVTAVMLWVLVQRLLNQLGVSDAEIRRKEEQARAIYDGVNEAIFIHDPKTGEILDVNLTACRMFGYDREELRGMTVEDLSSGEETFTQEHAMEVIGRGMAGEPVTDEWHARHRSGRLFWAEVNARPVVIGGQERLLVTGRDITARKKASEELRKLSRAVEQSPVSILITNLQGEIEYANEATFRLAGYTAEELIGKNPSILKSGHTSMVEYQNLWETISSGGEWHGEFQNRRKNGELYWETACITAIHDDAGNVTHYLAVKEDITERKLAEEKLMRQEALLEEAGEIAHVGGWEFDPATMTGSWSVETARIHDLDQEVVATPALGLSMYHGESRKRIDAALDAAIRDGTPYDIELEMITAKGRRKWVRTIGRPIMENGRVIRVRGSIQDITERKKAEQKLRDSRMRLRALLVRIEETREQERTRIAREVHDVLGQLLTGMKMDLSWLDRRLPRITDEELRVLFEQKIMGINALTDSMLESVQKISRDLRPSLLDNLGLTAAIQSEVRQFSERTGIACEITSLPASLNLSPDCVTHVFRIFQEILTNVARHSNATQVRIEMVRKPEGLTLNITDNGRGMSPEAMTAPGSLGLLGMSERAQQLGGRIEIRGEPGKGTSVTLTVPDETA